MRPAAERGFAVARRSIGPIAALAGMAMVAMAALMAASAAPEPARASPAGGARGDRYALEAAALSDSLLAAASGEPAPAARARLWGRLEAEALASRVRDLVAARGDLAGSVRLVLRPGPGTSPGAASLAIEPAGADTRTDGGGAARPAAARGGLEAVAGDASVARAFDRGARDARDKRGASTLQAIAAGVEAARDLLLERGLYAADVSVDSVAPGDPNTRVHLGVRPGTPVRLEAIALEGARVTRPATAAAIAGLKPGDLLRPARLDVARDRLAGSDLFLFVGAPRVLPGSAPDRARVAIPVEEARASRFDGVIGAAREGGVTGALDLALENIAGTGRAAGLRWAGLGQAGTEYEARYREPALFGKPLDASALLEAHVVDSLFTRTRWALGLGAAAGMRGRASLAFARTSTTYGGVARGTNGTWTGSLGFSWRALTPAANPRSGFAATVGAEAGARREETPGLPALSRRLTRGSLRLEGALPRGASSALYAAIRAEGSSLGGATFPVEELRYVGGSEGLRGHRDHAFAGNRVAVFTLEHRWITDPFGGRAYLFTDAAHHALDRELAAGTAAPGSTEAALARTELSRGWDFGYGAGLRARVAAGLVGVELGLRPGASLGAATLHLRYGSRW
ncbi:MAG TPA: BamA/TamA family outer membrane protein [Acidobacteriota bacterium]|nr:BamA/TamA family outer membrane protein [Acidobacteriota bacterium]